MKFFYSTIRVFALVALYFKMLVESNLRVARDAVTPSFKMKPAIIGIDLAVKSDPGIFMLVNLITMTPGTLSLDLSHDKKRLFVHVMYAGDVESAKAEIRKLEKRLKQIFE